MAKFLMFGDYSCDALGGISAERTEKAANLIKELGGEVTSMFVMLGIHDLLLVVELADLSTAVKASIALRKLTGIAFKTCPTIEVTELDKMMAGA